MTASRGGAIRRRPAAVVAPLTLAMAGCGGGASDEPAYTQESIKSGFVKPADLGKDVIEFEDTGVAGHIIYTPEDSVPTCPYAQRADDAPAGTTAAVQLQGGNATGPLDRRPEQPAARRAAGRHPGRGRVPDREARRRRDEARRREAVSKCPRTFTILGGPPQILGTYTLNTRPLELHGWQGFSQQLAHTSPRDVNPDTYDDLVTVVLHKGNAILYAGFAQIKNTGERADSGAKAEQVMKQALARLNP